MSTENLTPFEKLKSCKDKQTIKEILELDKAQFKILVVGGPINKTLKTYKNRYGLQNRNVVDCYNEFIQIYNKELR